MLSFEDYIRLEEASPTKHEFLAGSMRAMPSVGLEHGAVTVNVQALLGNALQHRRKGAWNWRGHSVGPCRVFASGLRLRVKGTGLATYADATVISGPVEVDPEDPHGNTVINPRVLVEVMTPDSEAYDRLEKVEHYKQIPSLEEIMLVAHDRQEIIIVRRFSGGWGREIVGLGLGVARLASIECDVPLADVYYNPLLGHES